MLVLRRSLRIYPEEPQSLSDCYGALHRDLESEVCAWLDLSAPLAEWPNGTWKKDRHSITCWEWSAGPQLPQKLLRAEFQQDRGSFAWEATASIGCNGEEALLFFEEWRLSTYKRSIPFQEMPPLFGFLAGYLCKDEDGLIANSPYIVSAERVARFVEFILSSARRVPVVLLTPSERSTEYGIPDSAAFARKLQGPAHVVRLQDGTAVGDFGALLPRHRCYDGAVRIYWPEFAPTDTAEAHPFRPRWHWERYGKEAIARWIFERLAQESLRLFGKNEGIRYLEKLQMERERTQQDLLRKKAIEQATLRLKAEQDAKEFVQLYEELEQEKNSLQQQNTELEKELNRVNDEVRKLRWQLNSAWQYRETRSAEDEPKQYLYLSDKAWKRYESFDSDERDYWNQHIFSKLLHEQRRQHQSEPVSSHNGTCWVYPRSGTGDGRRLIYYCDGTSVYVCELFLSAEHDDRYKEARNRGFDREEYDGFLPWVLE